MVGQTALLLSQPCHAVTCSIECPSTAPYLPPTTTTDDTFRYFETSTCPPYSNPNWSIPNPACSIAKTFKIPLQPKFASKAIPAAEVLQTFNGITYLKEDPAPILGAMGVFVNGVQLYGVGSPCGFSSDCPSDGAPSMWVDAVEAEGYTVDQCGGHADAMGGYHIHSGLFITNASQRTMCTLPPDTAGQHSELLAWLFDGVGLYGPNSIGGVPPTDLDECGGHTHNISGVQTYHYHLPDPPAFPWTIGCFKACPEVSNNQVQFSFLETDPSYGCATTSVTPTSATTAAGGVVPSISPLGLLAFFLALFLWMTM